MTLVINSTDITTDDSGRFSLNDLHRAAGGARKHEPNAFIRLESFKETVRVLTTQNPVFNPIVRKTGRYGGGTWVCKELVYKYAMWVNAEFEVKVIQTFDQITQKAEPPATLEALNELTRKIESDKELASKCGELLSKYKQVKRENTEKWLASVNEAQLTLGFTK